MRTFLPTLAALTVLAASARADDLLPPDRTIDQAIDFYVDQRLTEEKITPAPQADDVTVIRRLTLDLTGRIPTPAEVRAYVESTDPGKKVKLVDRLMASPGFVRHQATEMDVFLMAGTSGSIRGYMQRAVAENRPWDQVFRELILPDETNPKTKGASDFLRLRATDLDKMTAEVSVAFFGVNVSCARCHDHPLVQDWKQDHFYGMKSFFARTVDNGGVLAEREAGLVKFQTTKGVNKQARMMFLTGTVLDDPGMREPTAEEQKKEKELFEKHKQAKTSPPAPKHSARAQLVDVALRPKERDYFARAIVNRLWARFYGHGLVSPVDQMHSENPPSHPELLDWLARDLIAHGYDLKRLTRGLVLSKAYARSSRWENGTPPKPFLFAVARVRPLTPYQLAASLRIATTDPATLELKGDELEKKIEGLEQSARGFADLIEWPGDDFQVSVGEALLFSNGDRVRKEFLSDAPDRLLGRLKTLKNNDEVVDLVFRTVLSRPPAPEEAAAVKGYLDQRADRPDDARRQVVWALLTGAEFRFNY